MSRKTVWPLLLLTVASLTSAPALAQDIAVQESDINIGREEYSPYLHQSYPNRVFWGDTHLHTSYSTDAGMVGNTLGPDEALRFAKGEQVISSTGVPARLIRPLHFLVVSDHAENLGLTPMIEESNPELLKDPMGKKYHDLVQSGKGWEAYQLLLCSMCCWSAVLRIDSLTLSAEAPETPSPQKNQFKAKETSATCLLWYERRYMPKDRARWSSKARGSLFYAVSMVARAEH